MDFNWLHLTDLHFGMTGQKHLWPNIKRAFFEDIRNLHEKCGPWHAVFFTGDFVQSGTQAEYEGLNLLLDQLWEQLAKLGSEPTLIPVPGNHDLRRPDEKSPATLLLSKWKDFHEIHEEFWTKPHSAYRKTIDAAFANYMTWYRQQKHLKSVQVNEGLLPGDLSVTLEHKGVKIGVVGLNTTFLQLTDGKYEERLALDSRQFHTACGGDGTEWVANHQICVLLTHQGPEWLNEHSRKKVYPEINPAGRFAVHLFGHMHESITRTGSYGGGPFLRTWQGNSLFGLEHYGDEKKEDRRHGYSAGRIIFKEDGVFIRHWPRQTQLYGVNGWVVIPDYGAIMLEEDQGTRAEPVKVRDYAPEAPLPIRKPAPLDSPLHLWQEKLDYLLEEEALTADAAQKFQLQHMIEEAKRKIRELGN
jgi:hypothetical protein